MSSPLPFPALHASHSGIWIADAHGAKQVARGVAIGRAGDTPHLLLNAPVTASRLGYPELFGLDLLELFAFLFPARFVVPTPAGLAAALGLAVPECDADAAPFFRAAAAALLDVTTDPGWAARERAWTGVQAMMRLRWPWAQLLAPRIKKPATAERWLFSALPEWEEVPPRPQPRPVMIDPADVQMRLTALTGTTAEDRPDQRAYATAVTDAFHPRTAPERPNIVLAEAGTGIGKTLGYLAPASVWAHDAQGAVWISTFTKALQRQLDAETGKLGLAAGRVAIRKGRENYLCLLNLEDALQGGFAGRAAIFAQLVARWAAYSRDGDMVGGDLPGWLVTLFRRNGATALTDRRGECIYAGCPHYRKCFIERSNRASVGADLVIANHALVMVNAARNWTGTGRDAAQRPTRYLFDEGHHLFDAADLMFSVALTGQEAIELRRWIIGPESTTRGRRRGLAARLADVASYDAEGAAAINAAVVAAQALPSDGWLARVAQGEPFGAVEALLLAVRGIVYARDTNADDGGYGLETEIAATDAALHSAVPPVIAALEGLLRPLIALGQRLEAVLREPPDWLDAPARARVEGAVASLGWRADLVGAWLSLLARLTGPSDPDFVDWLSVERFEGRELDMGIRRHWLDPMQPFARTVLEPAHGVLVTSATLRNQGDWDTAAARTGAVHVAGPQRRFAAPSPFDYAHHAQVLIVTDVPRGDGAALAHAYARLIAAARGGTLGLFTAIKRLRAVHARIADDLAQKGLPLYAQHVDPIDTGTLVDIFRADAHASLLGTDALRDGVDVPGHSLRLVVMEGVPWVRPNVLHAARRAVNGGSAYDDMLVRARLAQAFGRLIRRADDRGTFVLLSPACPSRLLNAFPPGTPVARVSLDTAIERIVSQAQLGVGARDPMGVTEPLGE